MRPNSPQRSRAWGRQSLAAPAPEPVRRRGLPRPGAGQGVGAAIRPLGRKSVSHDNSTHSFFKRAFFSAEARRLFKSSIPLRPYTSFDYSSLSDTPLHYRLALSAFVTMGCYHQHERRRDWPPLEQPWGCRHRKKPSSNRLAIFCAGLGKPRRYVALIAAKEHSGWWQHSVRNGIHQTQERRHETSSSLFDHGSVRF